MSQINGYIPKRMKDNMLKKTILTTGIMNLLTLIITFMIYQTKEDASLFTVWFLFVAITIFGNFSILNEEIENIKKKRVHVGKIYRHYKPKGNLYKVAKIAEPRSEMPEGAKILHSIQTTYTEKNNPEIEVIVTDRGVYSNWNETLVIYQVFQQKEGVEKFWARPYGMFIDDVRFDGKRVPRFKLME